MGGKSELDTLNKLSSLYGKLSPRQRILFDEAIKQYKPEPAQRVENAIFDECLRRNSPWKSLAQRLGVWIEAATNQEEVYFNNNKYSTAMHSCPYCHCTYKKGESFHTKECLITKALELLKELQDMEAGK